MFETGKRVSGEFYICLVLEVISSRNEVEDEEGGFEFEHGYVTSKPYFRSLVSNPTPTLPIYSHKPKPTALHSDHFFIHLLLNFPSQIITKTTGSPPPILPPGGLRMLRTLLLAAAAHKSYAPPMCPYGVRKVGWPGSYVASTFFSFQCFSNCDCRFL